MLLYSLANVCKRIITKRKFTPLLFVHLIEQYKVSVVLTPPSQVAMLVQSPVAQLADLSTIRMYLVGGGFIPPHLRESLQDILLYGALVVTYGMTEVCSIISSTAPFQKPSNSTGKIMPNTKLKVRQQALVGPFTDDLFQVIDEDGNTLDLNEIGELYVMTSFKFLGYASNLEASKNAFDADGWLKTGDLGYLTESGEIFLVDRKKDMIKYLNYQVAPSELESQIQKMEGVEQACVVGIPDMISGDLAAAVIVKDNKSSLTEQDVVDEIASKFSSIQLKSNSRFF